MDYFKIGKKKINLGYLFILPGVLFFAVLAVYPALYVLYSSLFLSGKGFDAVPVFQGLKNFKEILGYTSFGKIFANTFIYAGGCTLLHMGGGLIMALLLNSERVSMKFRHIFRTLILVPWAVTPSVVAIVSKLFFHGAVGPIAVILKMLGSTVKFDPLGSTSTAMITVILTNAWKFMPFYFLILLAALQSIDKGLYEAASIDGASKIGQFFHVTLPQIKNSGLTLLIFDFVINAAYFDITWIMTQGGPMKATETLATLAYKTAFQSYKIGEASAMGVMLFAISVLFTIVVLRRINKE